jgi:hypothetical protein
VLIMVVSGEAPGAGGVLSMEGDFSMTRARRIRERGAREEASPERQ